MLRTENIAKNQGTFKELVHSKCGKGQRDCSCITSAGEGEGRSPGKVAKRYTPSGIRSEEGC